MKHSKESKEADTFKSIGIAPSILRALTRNNITAPTPIQHQAIPIALAGKDIVGIAQTGTGKTFAFGLPMLQQLAQGKGRGLVIVPTRELAYQVEESLRPYAKELGIRMTVFVGGSSMHLQRRALRQNPRILIATPGRLNDHLKKQTVTLHEVNILVLDEADRMLDMGFKQQINNILKHVPTQRQMLLFSATMPQSIFALAKREMQLPLRIEVAPAGTTTDNVEQELIIVRQDKKMELLTSLLQDITGSILVFTRTKYGASKLRKKLEAVGHRVAEIHSNRSLAQRKAALDGFQKKRHRILVATDIAARGIDVSNIAVVINYDLPDDPSDYVHRIGRTGRASNKGRAISFANPTQTRNVRSIEKLIQSSLPRKSHDSAQMHGNQSSSGRNTSFKGNRNARKSKKAGKKPNFFKKKR